MKLTLVATRGTKIRRKRNPKRTRVAKCVRKLKGRKGIRSPIAVCRKATRQSYATGRRLPNKTKRRRNPSSFPFKISVGGATLAEFRSLLRAKEYGQALANRTGRQVRLTA